MEYNKACHNGYNCPYLNNGDIFSLKAKIDYCNYRIRHMEELMEEAAEEIERLRQENQKLKSENEDLKNELKQQHRKQFKANVKKEESENYKKRGAPAGHKGKGRKRPKEVDQYIDIYPERCQSCGDKLHTYQNAYDEHIIEDIEIINKVICYHLYYGYCKKCHKVPYFKREQCNIGKGRIGPMAQAIAAHLRYLGMPYRKVAQIFNDVFNIAITHPSLLGFDKKQANNGAYLYKEIKNAVRFSSNINAAEASWRINGINHFLCVFANKNIALYRIERKRDRRVIEDTLGEKYNGILNADFYSAYDELPALAKQRCLSHLIREINKVQEKNKGNLSSQNCLFLQEIRETFSTLIGAWRKYRHTCSSSLLLDYKQAAISKLIELLSFDLENKDANRIRKRLIKYNQELLTFLDYPWIEPTNNRAERQLRPEVIMRKITFGNRSDLGAYNHALLMSIIQTAILNNVKPLDVLYALSIKSLPSFDDLFQIRGP